MRRLAQMYRGQYRVIDDAVETWKIDHDEAMAACDLEEIIRSCRQTNDACKKLTASALHVGFAGQVDRPEQAGELILRLLKSGVETWKNLATVVQGVTAAGYKIEGSDAIGPSTAELEALIAKFTKQWPFVLIEDVERGAAEIKAGKFVTGETLLRELNC